MSEVRVRDRGQAAEPGVVAGLAALPVAAVSDAMGRANGAPGILPVPAGTGVSMAGTALTVLTRPGDNLAVHEALADVRPGDVLVVAAGGHTDRAVVGEIIVRLAAGRGAVGVVVDGAVRDAAVLGDCGVPVFARAPCHLGPYKDGPGAVHAPVSVGGVTVRSGDVVVGDADGVAFVAAGEAPGVLAAAEAGQRKEADVLRAIADGETDPVAISARLGHATSQGDG